MLVTPFLIFLFNALNSVFSSGRVANPQRISAYVKISREKKKQFIFRREYARRTLIFDTILFSEFYYAKKTKSNKSEGWLGDGFMMREIFACATENDPYLSGQNARQHSISGLFALISLRRWI